MFAFAMVFLRTFRCSTKACFLKFLTTCLGVILNQSLLQGRFRLLQLHDQAPVFEVK